jgi:hypothetical protein
MAWYGSLWSILLSFYWNSNSTIGVSSRFRLSLSSLLIEGLLRSLLEVVLVLSLMDGDCNEFPARTDLVRVVGNLQDRSIFNVINSMKRHNNNINILNFI